jgi:hypothetical protein
VTSLSSVRLSKMIWECTGSMDAVYEWEPAHHKAPSYVCIQEVWVSYMNGNQPITRTLPTSAYRKYECPIWMGTSRSQGPYLLLHTGGMSVLYAWEPADHKDPTYFCIQEVWVSYMNGNQTITCFTLLHDSWGPQGNITSIHISLSRRMVTRINDVALFY